MTFRQNFFNFTNSQIEIRKIERLIERKDIGVSLIRVDQDDFIPLYQVICNHIFFDK